MKYYLFNIQKKNKSKSVFFPADPIFGVSKRGTSIYKGGYCIACDGEEVFIVRRGGTKFTYLNSDIQFLNKCVNDKSWIEVSEKELIRRRFLPKN